MKGSGMRTMTEGKAVGTLHEGSKLIYRDGSGSASWRSNKTNGREEREWETPHGESKRQEGRQGTPVKP